MGVGFVVCGVCAAFAAYEKRSECEMSEKEKRKGIDWHDGRQAFQLEKDWQMIDQSV